MRRGEHTIQYGLSNRDSFFVNHLSRRQTRVSGGSVGVLIHILKEVEWALHERRAGHATVYKWLDPHGRRTF